MLIIGCGLVSLDEEGLEIYPTKITKLDADSLLERNRQYHLSNNNQICSTLNEYGFTGFSRVLFTDNINPCLNREIVRVEMNNPDTLITYTKKVLVENVIYTNVEDSSELRVNEFIPLFGCTICEGPDINNVPIEWKISFKKQEIDSLTVEETEITVFIDADGVNRIWGNWYRDFFNPERPNIPVDEAKKSLIGTEFEIEANGVKTSFIITEELLSESIQPVIKPTKREDKLELRKAWKFNIKHPQIPELSWFLYIDVMDASFLAAENSD